MTHLSPRQIQTLLALIFIGLGGWCLVTPHMVERLVLRPEFQALSPASAVLFGCFGAQAVLCGTVIAFSTFTRKTFLVFGLVASVPFFGFNAYFYFIERIFTDWMLLDFVGNIAILVLCLYGATRVKADPHDSQ